MREDVRTHVQELIYQTYFNTADLNYIGARSSYFEQRDWDFWWLAAHALEKYLKAILLLNDKPAPRTHNVNELLLEVASLEPRLEPPAYAPPITEHEHIRLSHSQFLSRLETYGSPHNRYGLYGFTLMREDLFHVDQLVYWARRHALPLAQVVGGQQVDWISARAAAPADWLMYRGPLEQTARLPQNDVRRFPLARLNFPFSLAEPGDDTERLSADATPPIFEWLEALGSSKPGTSERSIAQGVLQWVLANYILDGDDRKTLRSELSRHP